MIDEQAVREWVSNNIKTKGYLQCDDIHVDEICAECSDKSRWLICSIEVMHAVSSLGDHFRAEFSAAVGIAMQSAEDPLGVNFSDFRGFLSELTVTPPSLYVFPRNQEPWRLYPEYCTQANVDCLPRESDGLEYILYEYKECHEDVYRRSLWILLGSNSRAGQALLPESRGGN
jgi:hypothetical protein